MQTTDSIEMTLAEVCERLARIEDALVRGCTTSRAEPRSRSSTPRPKRRRSLADRNTRFANGRGLDESKRENALTATEGIRRGRSPTRSW